MLESLRSNFHRNLERIYWSAANILKIDKCLIGQENRQTNWKCQNNYNYTTSRKSFREPFANFKWKFNFIDGIWLYLSRCHFLDWMTYISKWQQTVKKKILNFQCKYKVLHSKLNWMCQGSITLFMMYKKKYFNIKDQISLKIDERDWHETIT